MAQFIYSLREAAYASLFLFPVMLILHIFRFRSTGSSLLYFLLTVYFCGMYAVVGLPNITYIRFDPNIQPIPGTGLMKDLSGSMLNLVLFLPLGFLLPLLWKKYRRLAYNAAIGFILSMTIELLQIFTYRATDVNDLITNTLGAVFGYILWMPIGRRFPAIHGRTEENDFPYLLLSAAAVMFLLQPLIWMIV